jgi:hypothetical protein
MILTREGRRTLRKPCLNASLSATNPTWTDPDSNPGLRGERMMTIHPSYGTDCIVIYIDCVFAATRHAGKQDRSKLGKQIFIYARQITKLNVMYNSCIGTDLDIGIE